MADENENNEDSWLYGSGEKQDDENAVDNAKGEINAKADLEENSKDEAMVEESEPVDDTDKIHSNAADEMEEAEPEDGETAMSPSASAGDRLNASEKGDEDNSEDSEESDDDINVVIGDIKSGPSYNIKQRAGTAGAAANAPTTEKGQKQATGKFNMEEFESIGTISGVPAHEFSIDSLDEKPWRKPGADITDYFNYGFNEDTWRMYCERQKRMRQVESGAGLQGLMVTNHAAMMNSGQQQVPSTAPGGRTLTPIANDNSKYGALSMPSMLNRRAGPPPGRRMTGAIDVIGGNGMSESGGPGPRGGPGKIENAIQVMTAERREYSRPTGMPPGKFDMPPPIVGGSVGGGGGGFPPPGMNPNIANNGGNIGPSGGAPPLVDPFFEQDAYNYGYEPTQDSQWGPQGNPGWIPTGIKELTPGPPQMVPPPQMIPPHQMAGMPPNMHGMIIPPPGGPMMNPMNPQPRFPGNSNDRDRERRGERDRERDRERERERDRDRERSERSTGKTERDRDDVDKDRRSSRSDRDRRRERSRSRDRSRRRSRDKERERDRRDKKDKKRDKEDSD